MFPNQLGFLPRLNSTTIYYTPSIEDSFSDQAKKSFSDLVHELVAPNLVPSSISDIISPQGKTFQGEYLAAWNTPMGKASARIVSSENDSIVQTYIHFQFQTDIIVSQVLAKEIVPQYFVPTPQADFVCGTIETLQYCENFWTEADGVKIGVGTKQNGPPYQANDLSVFLCRFTPESDNYSWQSCAEEFAETGVQSPDPTQNQNFSHVSS